MTVIGIDPGVSGFFSAVSENRRILSYEMPVVMVKKTKKEYDPKGIIDVLFRLATLDLDNPVIDLVVLEKQQTMPAKLRGRRLGGASSGKIMYGFGLLHGILVGKGIRHVIVHPRTWRSKLLRDIPGDDNKGRSILAAQRLFPDVDLRRTERCRIPDHNKADSLLLAYYGMQWLLPEMK